MGAYCEFFYAPTGTDINFDPEFPSRDPLDEACRIKLKNINNMLHETQMTAGISPTHWQASTFPASMREKITVIHDGIDTQLLTPNADAFIETAGMGRLRKGDEVVTFVSRNLEPYRGFHIFMRALPDILAARPNARVLIIGAESKGYGAAPPDGTTWRKIFQQEITQAAPDMDWNRVSFLGTLTYPQFRLVLQTSAVHCYLTYPFVASWSLLEAMSTGVAVIGSDTPPVRELVCNNETGLITDFFDHKALAQKVCALLEDPSLRQKLGHGARQLIQDRYDLQSVCLPKQIEWAETLNSLP
jgi:glycosyltransferase involved in cell wall biosynthesis